MMSFTVPPIDKWASFRRMFTARTRATKVSELSAYREMARKKADGVELTAEEIDLLDQIADREKFNAVDDFMGDVEAFQNHDQLTADLANYAADSARLEAEMVKWTEEMRRLREELALANTAHRTAEAKLQRLCSDKSAIARLEVAHPRLFDRPDAVQTPSVSAPTLSKIRTTR